MAKQDSSSSQKGWKSADRNMTTSPSVGRFGNDQAASLYVKGSSAKFDKNDVRKNMAPYSNYGNLPQQVSQQPASDIVDLRTASGAENKPHTCLVPEKWGYSHQSMASIVRGMVATELADILYVQMLRLRNKLMAT